GAGGQGGFIVPVALPFDRERCNAAAECFYGAYIAQAEYVVRPADVIASEQFGEGARMAVALSDQCGQLVLVDVVAAVGGQLLQGRDVTGLAAEYEMRAAEEFSDPHPAECEIVGKADAVFQRQLDDEIDVFYSVGGPDELIRNRCFSALCKVAAHDRYGDVGT